MLRRLFWMLLRRKVREVPDPDHGMVVIVYGDVSEGIDEMPTSPMNMIPGDTAQIDFTTDLENCNDEAITIYLKNSEGNRRPLRLSSGEKYVLHKRVKVKWFKDKDETTVIRVNESIYGE